MNEQLRFDLLAGLFAVLMSGLLGPPEPPGAGRAPPFALMCVSWEGTAPDTLLDGRLLVEQPGVSITRTSDGLTALFHPVERGRTLTCASTGGLRSLTIAVLTARGRTDLEVGASELVPGRSAVVVLNADLRVLAELREAP